MTLTLTDRKTNNENKGNIIGSKSGTDKEVRERVTGVEGMFVACIELRRREEKGRGEGEERKTGKVEKNPISQPFSQTPNLTPQTSNLQNPIKQNRTKQIRSTPSGTPRFVAIS